MPKAFNLANELPILLLLSIIGSCALAYVIPFDVLFARATMNHPAERAIAMLFFWIAGLWLRRANGLSLPIVDLPRPVLTIALIAAGVAIWCIVLDAVVFRAILPPGYHALEQEPLSIRLMYFCSRAFNENVLYRLFLGSLFAWVLRAAFRRPELAFTLSMTGMLGAQLLNVGANMAGIGFSLETTVWLLLRFVAPGVLWAWLYVRHGFVANEAAAVGVHCFLQPAVTIAF